MKHVWTLEAELCDLAHEDDITAALHTLRLIGSAKEPYRIAVTQDWHAGGAETYILTFTVWQAGLERQYVMKACTAWAPGQRLGQISDSWLRRRTLLTELGVSTPALIGTGAALLVEEYIPYEFLDALDDANERTRVLLLRALGRTAGLLVRAGFAPLSTHDWRSRGADVVLIDFGQDLGPPGLALGSESGLLAELLNLIDQRNIDLASDEVHAVGAEYESALAG